MAALWRWRQQAVGITNARSLLRHYSALTSAATPHGPCPVYVAGGFVLPVTRNQPVSLETMGRDAVLGALADAGTPPFPPLANIIHSLLKMLSAHLTYRATPDLCALFLH